MTLHIRHLQQGQILLQQRCISETSSSPVLAFAHEATGMWTIAMAHSTPPSEMLNLLPGIWIPHRGRTGDGRSPYRTWHLGTQPDVPCTQFAATVHGPPPNNTTATTVQSI